MVWAIFVTFFNLNMNAFFLAVGVMPFVFNGSFVSIGLMLLWDNLVSKWVIRVKALGLS
jgi:hypothetical protein